MCETDILLNLVQKLLIVVVVVVGLTYEIYNCVSHKMLKYDSLLTALIYGLIGCFGSKLSDLTCPITNNCNRAGQIGQLSSQ